MSANVSLDPEFFNILHSAAELEQSAEISSFVNSLYGLITSSGNVNGIGENPTATRSSSSPRTQEASTTSATQHSSSVRPSGASSRSTATPSARSTDSTTSTSQSTSSARSMESMQSTMQTITSPTPTSISTAAVSSPNPPQPTIVQANHHHHLSGGAIAGIVVGVVIGAVLIGLLLFFCCFRKFLHRRRKRDAAEAAAAGKADALNRQANDDAESEHRDIQAYLPMQDRQHPALAAHPPTEQLEASTAAHQTATRVIDAPVSGTSFLAPIAVSEPALPVFATASTKAQRRQGWMKPIDEQSNKSFRSSRETEDTDIMSPSPISPTDTTAFQPTNSAQFLENLDRSRQARGSTGRFNTTSFVRGASSDFTLAPAVLARILGEDSPTDPNHLRDSWPLERSQPEPSPFEVSPLDTDDEAPNADLSQLGTQHENLQQQYPWRELGARRPSSDISPLQTPAEQTPAEPRKPSLNLAPAEAYADISSPFDANARLSYGLGASAAGTRTSIGAPPSVSWAPPSEGGRSSREWAEDVRSSTEERIRQWSLLPHLNKGDSPVSRPVSGLGELPSEMKRISTGDEPFRGVQEYLRKLSMISSNAGEEVQVPKRKPVRPPRYD